MSLINQITEGHVRRLELICKSQNPYTWLNGVEREELKQINIFLSQYEYDCNLAKYVRKNK